MAAYEQAVHSYGAANGPSKCCGKCTAIWWSVLDLQGFAPVPTKSQSWHVITGGTGLLAFLLVVGARVFGVRGSHTDV